jgi:hypothetical protein
MTFKDQKFEQRFQTMGDEAEGIFEDVYPQAWERFGLNRPQLQMSSLSVPIRYAPDYITSKGLIEVKGFGRDRTLKIKHENLDALWTWHQEIFRTDLFVWNRADQKFGFVRLPDLDKAIQNFATEDVFPEGKPYWALGLAHIPTTYWYGRHEPMLPPDRA